MVYNELNVLRVEVLLCGVKFIPDGGFIASVMIKTMVCFTLSTFVFVYRQF